MPTSPPPPARPQPVALDPPMLPFAVGGTLLWAVAGLAMLPFRDELAANGHGSWPATCLAGVVVGLSGIISMYRHDAHRRRRRAEEAATPR